MTICPVCKWNIDRTIKELDRRTYKFHCDNPDCIVEKMIIWEKNFEQD